MNSDYKFMIDDAEAFFQLTSDLICVADLESAKFLKINQAFMKIFGYTEEEMLSKTYLDFVHEEDRQKTIDIMESELKKGKELISFTNRYICKDGSCKWINWHAYPTIFKNLAYAVAQDVTECVKQKQAMKKKIKELEEIIDKQDQTFN